MVFEEIKYLDKLYKEKILTYEEFESGVIGIIFNLNYLQKVMLFLSIVSLNYKFENLNYLKN
jgi:hypothetical protein